MFAGDKASDALPLGSEELVIRWRWDGRVARDRFIAVSKS